MRTLQFSSLYLRVEERWNTEIRSRSTSVCGSGTYLAAGRFDLCRRLFAETRLIAAQACAGIALFADSSVIEAGGGT
jgi:hypothetical protein